MKVGLEIHQQLDVGKLFCSCEAELRKDKPDFTVERQLRAVAGETGRVDIAAQAAQAKGLKYIYEGYDANTCLVELDEEPPHLVNQEALAIALQVSLMLHCEIPDRIQIMRKTVVDGSNTTGFQRTACIGMNGVMETPYGKVGILSVCLEEDAARRIDEDKNSVTYRLDRLGIPLVEVATAPDMNDPDQVKFVARQLGLLIRATGKAKRGIGTIRQDVNVSIPKHPRIELKGVQDLRSMPLAVKKEAERQKKAVASRDKLEPHVRNVRPDLTSKYLRPLPGEARMYPETDHPIISISASQLSEIELPELPDHRLNRLKIKLNEELKNQILFSSYLDLFIDIVSKYKLDPKLIITTLLSTQKEAKKKAGQQIGEFTNQHFERIFDLISKGQIAKEAILDILVAVAQGKTVAEASKGFQLLSQEELKKEIARLKKKNSSAPEGKLKGIIIGQLRGKAKVEDIMRLL